MNSRVCALVSGGLDSGVLLGELARRYREVYPVFVRQGLVWETAELRALRSFLRGVAAGLRRAAACPVERGEASATQAGVDRGGRTEPRSHHVERAKLRAAAIQELTILAMPAGDLYGPHWSITGRRVPGAHTPDPAVYLPGRNLLLLAKAAVFCARHRIPVLAIGSLGHNPFPDATPGFFKEFAGVAGRALGCSLRVMAPFRALTKETVLRRGRHLPLHLSFSCLAPKRGRHCGRCNKCAERRNAFRAAGITDRTQYVHQLPIRTRLRPRSPTG